MQTVAKVGFTPEEMAIRRQGIGASEVAAIAGLNSWKSAVDIWLEKTGKAEPQPMTDRAELGHLVEPAIAEWYGRRVGATKLEKPWTMIHHPTEPWLYATPDLFVEIPGEERRRCEIKMVGFRLRQRWFVGDKPFIPDEVLAQCLIQGVCSGVHPCDVSVWFGLGPNEQFRIECPWLPDVAAELVAVAREFWFEHVLKDIPPPPDASASYGAYLKDKFPKHSEPLALAPLDAHEWAERYLLAKDEIALATKTKDEAEHWLKKQIGEREGIERPGEWIATWKSNSKGVPSWKRIAEELGASPALIAKHTGEPVRVFRCERTDV